VRIILHACIVHTIYFCTVSAYILYPSDKVQQGFRENRTPPMHFRLLHRGPRCDSGAYIRVKFNNRENCHTDYHKYYYYYYCTCRPLNLDTPNRKYVIIRWIYNGRDTDDDPSQIIASAGRSLSTRKPYNIRHNVYYYYCNR